VSVDRTLAIRWMEFLDQLSHCHFCEVGLLWFMELEYYKRNINYAIDVTCSIFAFLSRRTFLFSLPLQIFPKLGGEVPSSVLGSFKKSRLLSLTKCLRLSDLCMLRAHPMYPTICWKAQIMKLLLQFFSILLSLPLSRPGILHSTLNYNICEFLIP
jgi:hypothetical protein